MLAAIAIIAVTVVTLLGLWELDDNFQVTHGIRAWYIDGRDRGDHAWKSACWNPVCMCEREHKLPPATIIARLKRERALLDAARAGR